MMHGYYFGYGVNPAAINNVNAVSPVPQPPNTIAMTTPLPVPPTAPEIMLAVSSPLLSMGTSGLEMPNGMVFLGPQPEPPDRAFKRYMDFMTECRAQMEQKQQADNMASCDVMLAVFNHSWAMGAAIPPGTPVFLNPQPEPLPNAFKRFKNYVLALRDSIDLYTKRVEEALAICERIEREVMAAK